MIGVVAASVIGFALGIGLAYGLDWLFGVLNLDLPTTDMVIAPRTVIVAFLIGIVVTVLAAFVPSIRATRISPILAVREGRRAAAGRFSRFSPYIAGGLIVIALLLARSMFTDELAIGDRLLTMALGVLLLFVGVAMISPSSFVHWRRWSGLRVRSSPGSPATSHGGTRFGIRAEPPRRPPRS